MNNSNNDENLNTNLNTDLNTNLATVDMLLLGEYIINRRNTINNLRRIIDSFIINHDEPLNSNNTDVSNIDNTNTNTNTNSNVEHQDNQIQRETVTIEPITLILNGLNNTYDENEFRIRIWDENSGLRHKLETALADFRIDSIEQNIKSERFQCGVCYEDKISKVSLDCGHSVCYSCICDWIIHKNNTCPFCRYQFVN